jgi:hypothetical protein
MMVRPDVLDHWKTQMLRQLSGQQDVITWLIALWGHCQVRKSCRFRANPKQLAAICRYVGKAAPEEFAKWLIEAGFVDHEKSEYIVHDWEEHNQNLLKCWRIGKMGGRPKTNAGESEYDRCNRLAERVATVRQ